MNMEFFSKMRSSLFSADWYIFVWFVITAILFAFMLYESQNAEKQVQDWKSNGKDVKFAEDIHKRLSMLNTMFTTCVSIFPLLGMFGTVIALLNLDIGSGISESIQNKFFSALTSTAWGIVFSIFFKAINSMFQSNIEFNIDEAKRLSEQTYHLPPSDTETEE